MDPVTDETRTSKQPAAAPSARLPEDLDFVQALNEAAAFLQQSASSVAEVHNAVRQQITRLGLTGALSLPDESTHGLRIEAVAMPVRLQGVLSALESQLACGPRVIRRRPWPTAS